MIDIIAVTCSVLGALLAIPRAISETRRLIKELRDRRKSTASNDEN